MDVSTAYYLNPRKYNTSGGIIKNYYKKLKIDSNEIAKITGKLLEDFFPETIHNDLKEKLDIHDTLTRPQKRDPNFRSRVLTAYDYKCAICKFDCRLGHTPIGIEAAHIRWHQNNGPSIVNNGIAMCTLHHKLFDRGVIGVTKDYKVAVSKKAYGDSEFKRFVLKYDGKSITTQSRSTEKPNKQHLKWHLSNIFQP